jgi:hypothetical protein
MQKISHFIKALGYEVYWPVISEFKWLNNYIKDFHFISWNDEVNHISAPPLPEEVVFPYKEKYLVETKTEINESLFFFQGFINVNPIMAGKYNSIDLDWKDWRDYVIFDRNKEKEDELYYDVLNLKDEEEFIFVNRKYCTRPNIMTFNGLDHIINRSKKRIIDMSIIDGFSLFDWCKVLEKASEIHMIETSLNYLLESPNLYNKIKTKSLYLYSRQSSFHEVEYLFNLPWNYIT